MNRTPPLKAFRRLFIWWGAALLLPLLWTSCQKDHEDPIPDPALRTIVMYMVPDNALYPFALDNIEQIRQSWDDFDGNLVIYLDPPSDIPRMMHIKKGGSGQGMAEVIHQYSEQNSASPSVMRSIIQQAFSEFPSQKTALILWGHGTGWLPPSTYTISKKMGLRDDAWHLPQGFVKSFGLDNNVEMSIPELESAIPQNLDFILFDVCLMGGVEVAYQLRNKTEYILASPTEILGTGLPYNQILPMLFNPRVNLERIAELYYDFYNEQTDIYRSASIGLIRTAELENLASTVKNIVKDRSQTIRELNLSEVQTLDRLYRHLFYDLGDFIRQISSEQEYAVFEQQLNRTVLYKAATPYFVSIEMLHFSGLSCFIPQNQGNQFLIPYASLEWTKAIGLSTDL